MRLLVIDVICGGGVCVCGDDGDVDLSGDDRDIDMDMLRSEVRLVRRVRSSSSLSSSLSSSCGSANGEAVMAVGEAAGFCCCLPGTRGGVFGGIFRLAAAFVPLWNRRRIPFEACVLCPHVLGFVLGWFALLFVLMLALMFVPAPLRVVLERVPSPLPSRDGT